MITGVIRDLLLSDATVSAALSTYKFGECEATAAIFTGYRIPEDATFPVIIVNLVGSTNFGTLSQRGMDLHIDVSVYDDKELSTKALTDLAFAIWKCCDRACIQPWLDEHGYEDYGCRAQGPVFSGGEDNFPGYNVQVRARVLEKGTP